MNEPNKTPKGQLAKYLIGDLGIAWRLVERCIDGQIPTSLATLMSIKSSIETCMRRAERDIQVTTSTASIERIIKLCEAWQKFDIEGADQEYIRDNADLVISQISEIANVEQAHQLNIKP